MTKIEDAKQFMKKIRECSQSDITDKSIMSLNESTTKKSDITHNHSWLCDWNDKSSSKAEINGYGCEWVFFSTIHCELTSSWVWPIPGKLQHH